MKREKRVTQYKRRDPKWAPALIITKTGKETALARPEVVAKYADKKAHVLKAIRAGYSQSAIARHFGIGPHVVSFWQKEIGVSAVGKNKHSAIAAEELAKLFPKS